MTIVEIILENYPEIDPIQGFEKFGIEVQDDSDGIGAYIAKWEYSQPLPKGLTLGKPSV